MAEYKSVKIIFDLSDEHQLKLYELLKSRSNQSSYIRALLYKDMDKPVIETPKDFNIPKNNILNTVTAHVDEDIVLEGLL